MIMRLKTKKVSSWKGTHLYTYAFYLANPVTCPTTPEERTGLRAKAVRHHCEDWVVAMERRPHLFVDTGKLELWQ
jgi:hypothetical protein